MTCGEVTELLDAFVDAELPAPMLLSVARHAGGCAACDASIRELSALHEAVERVAREDADAIDLNGVWPAVEAGKLGLPIDRTFALDEVTKALARMQANAHFGKIVLAV